MEPMRKIIPLFFLLAPVFAQGSDQKDVLASIQKLFDAMAARDGAAIRATSVADARIYSPRNDGPPGGSSIEEFVTRITSSKEDLLERFTGKPMVMVGGAIAQVWSEYEFLQGGKFHHCGIDTATLFKTPAGWKIAALAFTRETTGCKGH